MQDLYTRKMTQATIDQIYEGLKNAFNSVSEVYVKTPRIKGKIFGKYLITEQSGAYNAYDTETDFTYIKQQIIKNEPLHSKAIFQHMPFDKIYDFLEIEEGNPITPEFRLDTQSWIHTYMNNKYNLGVGSTSSLYKLRNLLNDLSSNGFMTAISEKEVESWSGLKVYDLEKSANIIKKLFTVATEKKHVFNDGDNAIYLKNDGLVVQNQNYGYYIKKTKNDLTLYAYSNDDYKKHKNLAQLIKEIESDKSLSLIDNVAVKITDGKVVFGDYLFTYMNLMQDMEIAKDEIQNMKPRKSTMKRKM